MDIFREKQDFQYPALFNILRNTVFPLVNGHMKSKVSIVGTSTLGSVGYYSDIDAFCIVHIDEPPERSDREFVTAIIQKLSQTQALLPESLVTDIKAGGKHFTPAEVDSKRFYEAIREDGYTKIDYVIPFIDRYIETSCLYYVKDTKGWFAENPLETVKMLQKILEESREEQVHKGKLFKALKREFSILKYNKSKLTSAQREYATKILLFLRSPVGMISKMAGDLETLDLILKKSFDKKLVISEFNTMLDRISGMYPQDIDQRVYYYLNQMIMNVSEGEYPIAIHELYSLLKDYVNKKTHEFIVSQLGNPEIFRVKSK